MNIYFCGSIRGGRQDVGIYQQIVTCLKAYGRVLTEHVAFPELEMCELKFVKDFFFHIQYSFLFYSRKKFN